MGPNGRVRVLVVDDDPIALAVTDERLQRAGYETLLREQAIGTSAVIVSEKPEILLLDVSMPGLNGGMLADLVKRRIAPHQTLGVIFYSSKDEDELATLVRETGALGAISKRVNAAGFSLAFDRLARAYLSTQR